MNERKKLIQVKSGDSVSEIIYYLDCTFLVKS